MFAPFLDSAERYHWDAGRARRWQMGTPIGRVFWYGLPPTFLPTVFGLMSYWKRLFLDTLGKAILACAFRPLGA